MSNFTDFSLNLESFITELNSIITTSRENIEKLLTIKEKTYHNFIKPLEDLEEDLELFFTPLSHINSVNNSPKSQSVYSEAIEIVTDYSNFTSQHLGIYSAFKEIKEREYSSLSVPQQRVIDLNILHFELSGAHLDDTKKERLAEINLRKSALSNDFSQNLLDATNAYEKIITDPADVDGIPSSDLESAKIELDGKSAYRFTLQMPSYIAYMTYGANREIREELYRAYTTRAPENAEIIDELLRLRDESSKILGFDNYSDYSLASKMAPDSSSVLKFLETLLDKSTPQAKEELAELEEFAKTTLESFDSAFYSERLKKARYDIDEEEYRVYFEQNRVVDGTFRFLEKLLNIEFKKLDSKLWDEKASLYDIYEDGRTIARIYLDLEARESKRGGAWMHNFESHHIDRDNATHLASAFVVCNFPPSSPTNPSLLRHDDVVTLFHEMGHAIHHLLSRVSERGVSGVNGVEWDAVEFPSQFLENFAYEPEVLKIFAKHYESDETISDEMIEKLIRAKNFQSALSMLRQLEFSIFDFALHSKLHQADEVQELLDSIREKTALIKPPSYNKFQNGFAHIFSGGYSAGYYSYKWAEVLSADAYFAIVDEGIFNSPLAQKYKDIILAKGGSESMGEIFREFLGRDASPEQLLRLNGIAV